MDPKEIVRAGYDTVSDAYRSLAWLAGLGFDVLWTRFIPEANTGHTLLLARSP